MTTLSVFSPTDQALLARVNSVRPSQMEKQPLARKVVQQPDLTAYLPKSNDSKEDNGATISVFSPKDQVLLARVNSARAAPKQPPKAQPDLTCYLPKNKSNDDNNGSTVDIFSRQDQALLARVNNSTAARLNNKKNTTPYKNKPSSAVARASPKSAAANLTAFLSSDENDGTVSVFSAADQAFLQQQQQQPSTTTDLPVVKK